MFLDECLYPPQVNDTADRFYRQSKAYSSSVNAPQFIGLLPSVFLEIRNTIEAVAGCTTA